MKFSYSIAAFAILCIGFGAGLWMGGGESDRGLEEAESAVYRCPMHPTVVSDRPGACPVCGMDMVPDRKDTQASNGRTGERKVLYWRAPMDPNYTSETPGKSPMGMDLVPVYEDEVMGSGGGVKIDAATVQKIGVKTALINRQALLRQVRAVGTVDYDETRITDVNTKITGWVETLFVDFTGQNVKKGQPLLEIYSPELVAAQEEYLTSSDYVKRLKGTASQDVLKGAQDLLHASKQRLLYWDITEGQIDELERKRTVQRTMTVYSPQEGVVTHKAVNNGAYIKAGQHLYRIAALDSVWVYADIYEYEMPWVKVGQQAEVVLPSMPGKIRVGKVIYIFPFLEPKTRTVRVRMAFDNAESALKPDMFASVKIKPVVSLDAVVVPIQAVIHSGERNVVIIDLGEGRFMPREVVLGVEAEGVYEVLEGLSEGERIVTSSQFLIDSESNLKAALAGMSKQGAGDATRMSSKTMEQPESKSDHDETKAPAGHQH
jgi:Cu(I)/Ag(I) efflux system membrane fusion protein/cobalt-zinc-cadmium efflux system membrane fusion protein